MNEKAKLTWLPLLTFTLLTGALAPAADQTVRTADWEVNVLSVQRLKSLKAQTVEGAGFDGTMLRGGQMKTTTVTPTNGQFLVLNIEAKRLRGQTPTRKPESDPWKAAAEALRSSAGKQPLAFSSELTYLVDASGRKYPCQGSLREDGGELYMSMVQGVNIMGDSSKFNLFFDVPADATDLKLRPSDGFQFLALATGSATPPQAPGTPERTQKEAAKPGTESPQATPGPWAIKSIQPTITGQKNEGIIHARRDGDTLEIWARREGEAQKLTIRGRPLWVKATSDKGGSIQYGARGEIILGPDSEALLSISRKDPPDAANWFQGVLDFEDSSYTLLGRVPIFDFLFESRDDAPLTFRLNKDKGFVYVSGKGKVKDKNGNTLKSFD